MTESEFAFAHADFKEICDLIYSRAGIRLNDSKKPMVYSRLARRLRAMGISSFSVYLDFLKANPDSNEWTLFTNALTTNLTAFFREAHHFEVLSSLLPGWYESSGKIRIWCCASSTGEEPYSIMMTAQETFGNLQPPVGLLASDLDTHVLERAKQGIYSIDRISSLSALRKKRFFLRGKGASAGLVRVRNELKEQIDFRQINLLESHWPCTDKFDAIFCRNVMIYFDRQTQHQLLSRFASYLKPHGRLFVGHSENLHHVSDVWTPCGQTVYRLKVAS